MKNPLLWICVITVIIGAALVITIVRRNSARWIEINNVTGYAKFTDKQIEKITLRKSVTSPERAVFSDDNLISKWKEFFQKLELNRIG
mgnify:FL=1